MYKAAVIGCGRIGFGFDEDPLRDYVASHSGAYSKTDGVDLVAVCDVDMSQAEKCADALSVPGVYNDIDIMLEKENPDIISVCTPVETHLDVIKRAVVNSGLKAVFCEKPIASGVSQGLEILRLCRESDVLLQIGHQRRFDKLHNDIRSKIDERVYGDVQQINFYYTSGVNNTGSHMFDLLRFFFGDVEWVEAVDGKNMSGNQADPNLDGMIRFKNGTIATFQSCEVTPYYIFEMNCLMERSRIVLKDSGFSVDFYGVRENSYYSGYKELYRTESPFNESYKREHMLAAVAHLCDCLEHGKRPVSSGEDGLKALELIEKSMISARDNGKRIFLEQ